MNTAPIFDRMTPSGNAQKVYRFENGYGASVVIGPYTYGGDAGLFEVAVIKFEGPGDDEWHLTYDTPVTDDVIGYQDDEGEAAVLQQIAALDE